MLHVISQKPSNLYKRYKPDRGQRASNEGMVHAEDEITSAIIGPMDFMMPDEILRFWSELFIIKFRHDVFGDLSKRPLEKLEVKLWPSKIYRDGGIRRSVEPDATIEFIWPNNTRILLLIEFKWRALLSKEDQLHRQWNRYLTEKEQAHAFHLFIAPVVAEGASARNSELGDIWGDQLILITWETFRIALNTIKKNDRDTTSLGRWSTVADRFLQKIGIETFGGFDHLAEELDFSIPSPYHFSGIH